MKIAVTGSSGFIGTYLIEHLRSKKNVEIIPLTRDKESKYYTDYSVENLSEWLDGVKVVIHLAAKRGGGTSLADYDQNIILSENVARACRKNSVDKLIFISSISVYSDQNKLPWHEEQKNIPKNYYGLSKIISEEVCRLNLAKSSTKLVILRLAHVYGPNEKNNYMINLFMRKAFNKENIHVTSVNLNKREFIYVKDVVKAIVLSYEKDINCDCVTMNIGTKDELTNSEVAKIISEAFNVEAASIDSITTEISQDNSYMDCRKSEKLLQFIPEYDMLLAMKDIYKIMKRSGKNVPIFY